MSDANLRLIVVDPGHFHAALVQREMFEGLSPLVRVHAPLGAELLDYLGRIARFNARADSPTDWRIELHAGPDFPARLRDEPPGGVVVLSGRNGGKIGLIEAAVAAGLHVLCDKPAIIRRDDLRRLAAVLDIAARRRLVVADMMTGRVGIMSRLIQSLAADQDVFGEPQQGTREDPAVVLGGVHHLYKTVSGVVNRRPPWYFDIHEQGEGLADTGVHLVDRAHETLFPGAALDHRNDITVLAAARWPTWISAAQFEEVTGTAAWPPALLPWVEDGRLACFCNGRADYRVRGIHVRLETVWEWQAAPGRDDTQAALFRGTRSDIALRQGAAEKHRPELYLVPHRDIAAALQRWAARVQPEFAGVGVEERGDEWRISVPAALRMGHEAQFAAFARRFLDQVRKPESAPARDRANLLAKYQVTTEAVAASHHARGR